VTLSRNFAHWDLTARIQVRATSPSNDEYSVHQLKMMFAEIEGIIEKELDVDMWNNL
jgi:hypothetical protein